MLPVTEGSQPQVLVSLKLIVRCMIRSTSAIDRFQSDFAKLSSSIVENVSHKFLAVRLNTISFYSTI